MPENDFGRQMMGEEIATTFHRLRRLQEHIRSNIPAMIAQRAGSTFTLQEEPAPKEAVNKVSVAVYPQNPFVGQPEVRTISADEIRPGLINNRMLVQDSSAPSALPQADGSYLYWPGTPEFAQVNSFYYTNLTLRMYERYAKRAIPWAFPMPRIILDPHAGEGANAFYSEQDRLIGFHSFTMDGETMHTAHSADIVSHEAAHAILDGLRDLYNESFGLVPPAFHESFGDMSAVLAALHDDSLVHRLLDLTGGNLHLDNFVSAVAEHLTERLLQHEAEHVSTHSVYLRNGLNSLTFKPFDELPYTSSNPQIELGRESHNYSRLFTGAFYDFLVGVYEQLRQNLPANIALHKARDVAGSVLTCALELGPVGEFDYGDMARAFLTADTILNDGQHIDILVKVFDARGMLSSSHAVTHLGSLRNLPDIRLPESINSAMASALFLEQQVIPALGLPGNIVFIPMAALRNAAGYAYLTYFSTRQVDLAGEEFGQFNGATIDVFGGLTLMFDGGGRLRSVCFRHVTDEDERQIRIMTAELIQSGLIMQGSEMEKVPPEKILYSQPGAPHALSLPGFDWSRPDEKKTKLVRFPVIFDPVPEKATGFLDRMQTWLRDRRE